MFTEAIGYSQELTPAQVFGEVVNRLVTIYQGANANESFLETSRAVRFGMEVLTGQLSTSEWTKEQVSRVIEEEKNASVGQVMMVFGICLLLVSDTCFKVLPQNTDYQEIGQIKGGTLLVWHPPLPDEARFNPAEKYTTLGADQNIHLTTGLKAIWKGGQALIKSVGGYYARGVFSNVVGKGERVLREYKDHGRKLAYVEVTDRPGEPGGWGRKARPPETHVEQRVKFKGHYRYRPETAGPTSLWW